MNWSWQVQASIFLISIEIIGALIWTLIIIHITTGTSRVQRKSMRAVSLILLQQGVSHHQLLRILWVFNALAVRSVLVVKMAPSKARRMLLIPARFFTIEEMHGYLNSNTKWLSIR